MSGLQSTREILGSEDQLESDSRLPERVKEDLRHIVLAFALSHSVDELMYMAGAFEDAAQRKAGGHS